MQIAEADTPITRAELALKLRVTDRTLRTWQREGYGPRARKVSPNRTIYDRSEVESFIKSFA